MIYRNYVKVGIITHSLFSTCAFADTAQISMECHNNSVTVSFQHGADDQGIGHAMSPKLQFNINTDAPQGVIFVNQNNDGVCTASIGEGYMITSGRGVIDPVDAYVKGGKPSEIVNLIRVVPNTPTFNQIEFDVRYVKGTGTANIKFLIDYKRLE